MNRASLIHRRNALAVAAATALETLATIGRACTAVVRDTFRRRDEPVLDDATLRDLGISRSELASIEAEVEGRVEATRRRITGRSATFG